MEDHILDAKGDVCLLFNSICDTGETSTMDQRDSERKECARYKVNPERPAGNADENFTLPRQSMRMIVSSMALIAGSPVFKAMLSKNAMREGLALESTGFVEIPLPDDDPEAFLLLMNIIHQRVEDIPKRTSLMKLAQVASLVDKYDFRQAVEDYVHKLIVQLQDTVPTSLTSELLPWLWIYWVFGFRHQFKKLTAIAQKECKRSINEQTPYNILLPEFIIRGIETRRVKSIAQIQSLLVAEIEDQRDSARRAASPEELAFWGDGFRLLRAFWLGFLTLEGSRWGILPSQSFEDQNFYGISFNDLSIQIRTMTDPDDWMIGTLPPERSLPNSVAMILNFVPLVGAAISTSGCSMYGTSNIKKRFVELIDHLEKEEWGLDLK